MAETTEAYGWTGRELVDAQGEKVGSVADIYNDAQTGEPEWALVKGGLLGSKQHFVPLAGAAPDGEAVRVRVSREQVKEAPGVEAGAELSQDEERRLFEHYGVQYSDEGSVTAQEAPEAENPSVTQRDSSGSTDEAMTRSEEEIHVGTERREAGRVRLRKYVVTEQVQTTVPVQREEVRLEREPITDANAGAATEGPAISEDEHEVVLHEEQPVVEKHTVPKERVRLGKDVQTDERAVSDEVRKERIDVDEPSTR